jgi:hypothetical protein
VTSRLRRCAVTAVLVAGACASLRLRPATPWALVEPPEVADVAAPRGYRLLPGAPLAEWRAAGRYASAEECEAARTERFLDAIGRARRELGDDEAHLDLGLRRAVNARCLRVAAP